MGYESDLPLPVPTVVLALPARHRDWWPWLVVGLAAAAITVGGVLFTPDPDAPAANPAISSASMQ